MIDQLTLPEAEDLFEYWLESPPAHELLAIQVHWEKPMTYDEKIGAGAMGPADFLKHYEKTKGIVNPKAN